MSHEVFLYCFDAVPMFLAVASMNWTHPSEVAKHIRELKGTGEKAKHSTDGMRIADV